MQAFLKLTTGKLVGGIRCQCKHLDFQFMSFTKTCQTDLTYCLQMRYFSPFGYPGNDVYTTTTAFCSS